MSDDSRRRLRNELLAGALSKPAEPVSPEYFEHLRQQVFQLTPYKRNERKNPKHS